MDPFYKSVFHHFPSGIELAFAYGSGVFQQNNNNTAKENMVDLFFIVEDSALWHKTNIERHPGHYSFLSFFGPDYVTKIQSNYGSKIYFNTLVRFEGRMIKYGVMSVDDFLADLKDWETLYTSGRLHKPVLQLKNFHKDPFKTCWQGNLVSAVNASRLLLPERFTEEELFLTITGLSYSGDFRMVFGEDKNKIKNIVLPNIKSFREVYKDTIDRTRITLSDKSLYIQDISAKERTNLLLSLPLHVKKKLFSLLGYQKNMDFSVVAQELSENRKKCSDLIHKSVSSIVLKSSITQSLKGVLTAGVSKSVIYSAAKIRKMAKSILR